MGIPTAVRTGARFILLCVQQPALASSAADWAAWVRQQVNQLPASRAIAARQEQWLADNRQHKHGTHRYTLEEFGLEAVQVKADFAEYCEELLLATNYRMPGQG